MYKRAYKFIAVSIKWKRETKFQLICFGTISFGVIWVLLYIEYKFA